jgi:hypothetical protein
MDVAKDGSITSPVDDIPELSFRGKKGGMRKRWTFLSPRWTGTAKEHK